MAKMVVVFIASPGAGKGTQADILARKFGLYHLESSKVLEKRLAGQENSDDPEVREAWRLYKAGKLMTPSLVARLIMEEIERLHQLGKSIVFSGSFRTLEEAEKEVPLVEKLYGKENVKFIFIKLSEKESIQRNSSRRICQLNRHPIPGFPQYRHLATCPEDGSPLITRELDNPETVKERYGVFLRETAPVLDYLKTNGYRVIEINGEQPIGKVAEDILRYLPSTDNESIRINEYTKN